MERSDRDMIIMTAVSIMDTGVPEEEAIEAAKEIVKQMNEKEE